LGAFPFGGSDLALVLFLFFCFFGDGLLSDSDPELEPDEEELELDDEEETARPGFLVAAGAVLLGSGTAGDVALGFFGGCLSRLGDLEESLFLLSAFGRLSTDLDFRALVLSFGSGRGTALASARGRALAGAAVFGVPAG
jgi:hypothetical protein